MKLYLFLNGDPCLRLGHMHEDCGRKTREQGLQAEYKDQNPTINEARSKFGWGWTILMLISFESHNSSLVVTEWILFFSVNSSKRFLIHGASAVAALSAINSEKSGYCNYCL